jgi:hypothetical protein
MGVDAGARSRSDADRVGKRQSATEEEAMQQRSWTGKPPLRHDDPDKVRAESRRFIDSLATRFAELDAMAAKVKDVHVFSPAQLAAFHHLFATFRAQSDEFLALSQVTARALAKYREDDQADVAERQRLDANFHNLQVPMLHRMISTNLRLLRIWDDCIRCGEALPYGAYEIFLETLRIIYQARIELLRPCYAGLLDETALKDADRVERLLGTLMRRAPRLLELVTGETPPP